MTTHSEQYLTFIIRGEEHAVPILRVKEIIEFETVTGVPGTPPWVRGVINLRGAILPVVDLAAKFGHPPSPVIKTTCTVVVETELRGEMISVGVMADAVSEVLDLSSDQIEPPPSFGTQIRVDYLLGMGKLERKLVLILDIDRLLSPVELEHAVAATETAHAPAALIA
jgi:purine-binding chemotaxis protein CheW